MSSIFLSYRRETSDYLTRCICMALEQRGHKVFMDVNSNDVIPLDTSILTQIAERPHFILILSPGSLKRCANEGDWLRREIEEAFRLRRNIIPVFDKGFDINTEKAYLSETVATALARRHALTSSHEFFDSFIDKIHDRCLDDFVPNMVGDLPAPFAWVDIPEGTVTLGSTKESKGGYITKATNFDVPAFAIAKYPVTNAQFAKFIMDDGYDNKSFWTPEGWLTKKDQDWKRPRLWDDKNWNGDDSPVVGVSWYEAVAFCRWLSKITGEAIALPSDQEWQLAAQGDDDRAYPWGDEWDASCCNSSVKNNFSHATTPVEQFEGKGDSPYGVVDMAGNVWEWCATNYQTGSNDIDGTANRVVRGGAYFDRDTVNLRVTTRSKEVPDYCHKGFGFRIVRK